MFIKFLLNMITWFFISVLLIFLSTSLWKQKWVLYHSFKIPGPIAIPFVVTGSVAKMATATDFFKFILNQANSSGPVFKLWIGPQLYIFTKRSTDAEIVLTTCLNKSSFYELFHDAFENTILTAEATFWKPNRKLINQTFNPKILNSFHETFVKYSKRVRKFIDDTHELEVADLTSYVWKIHFDTAMETLMQIDPTLIKDRYDIITFTLKGERAIIQRLFKFWLLLDIFWKASALRKEVIKNFSNGRLLGTKILLEAEKVHAAKYNHENTLPKQFLPHLLQMCEENKISQKQILEETLMMSIAASETTAITVSAVLMFLGMYPEIQNKVYEELVSVLKLNEEDPTRDEINRLEYLERVIKETLRLAPVFPMIARSTPSNIKFDPYIFPAGSDIVISIIGLHLDPEVWPNPKEFNPDRFLPEEVQKRHRCSFMPFGFGTRNCVGLHYGMMSMKTQLCIILKQLKVKTLDWQSWDDIEWEFMVLLKPQNCRMVFEKRVVK